MPTEKRAPEPNQAEVVKQAGAAAMEEVLAQDTYSLLLRLTENELIKPKADAEILNRSTYRSSCWGHAPSQFELLSVATRRLNQMGGAKARQAQQVERVHARLVPGTKLVIIRPAALDDMTALPVHRYSGSSSAWINLITLLGPEGLALETGYRERYHVAYLPKESQLWPGLVIDFGKPIERRQAYTPKKKNG